MATRTLQLPVPAPRLIGGNYAPARVAALKVSTGTETAGEVEIGLLRLAFSATVDEAVAWVIYLPADYVSGGTVRFLWSTDASSGSVKFRGGSVFSASTDGPDTDTWITLPFAGGLGAVPVPSPAGELKSTSITLDTTGMAASGLVWAWVGRYATHVDDTVNANEIYMVAARFEYEDA